MRKRGPDGKYVSKKNTLLINLPNPIDILKVAIILFVISPWIYAILNRCDLKELFIKLMEYLFKINSNNEELNKKSNGFFK